MESIGISVMASFRLLLLLFFTLYYDTLKKVLPLLIFKLNVLQHFPIFPAWENNININ